MDVGGVSHPLAVEAMASALVEAADAGQAVDAAGEAALGTLPGTASPGPGSQAPGLQIPGLAGLAERLLGEDFGSAAPAAPPPPSGEDDHGLQSASVQTFARPHAPVAEPARPADSALPHADHAGSVFAIPADQLVPVALTGLQVDPAASWPLLRQAFDPVPTAWPRAPAHEPPMPPQDDEHADEPAEEEPPPPEAQPDPRDGIVFDDAQDNAWCEPLTRALRAALAAKVPPHSLLVAAEQWQRGRCVVLACPQGRDPAGPAWAFVLWPRRQAQGFEVRRLELHGLRVEARLQWSASPTATPWCHVRVVKEHHPRRGRQLLALDPAGAAPGSTPVPCEVQLGPVLARSLRWAVVCVRIDAVRRFWAALGVQWSATVVVCAQALAGATEAPDIVELPC